MLQHPTRRRIPGDRGFRPCASRHVGVRSRYIANVPTVQRLSAPRYQSQTEKEFRDGTPRIQPTVGSPRRAAEPRQHRGGRGRGRRRGASGAARRPRPPGPAAVGGRPLRPRPEPSSGAGRGSAAATSAPPSSTCSARPPRPDGEPVNGYQVIQQIAERSGGAWRPSPGSVYPTIQQLQDEGLVETDDERGRKTLALTAEGATYVAEHADELAAVWAPFDRRERDEEASTFAELKPEIGQVMGAVWQIVTAGSEPQQRAAIDVLVDTRRQLYGILADGDDAERRRRRRGASDDRPDIRLSDAEREAAAADLGEHFAQGRLTADEHAERLEQVWAAKTRGEIAPIFRDLPSPYAAVAAGPVGRDGGPLLERRPPPVSPRGSGPAPGGAGRADRALGDRALPVLPARLRALLVRGAPAPRPASRLGATAATTGTRAGADHAESAVADSSSSHAKQRSDSSSSEAASPRAPAPRSGRPPPRAGPRGGSAAHSRAATGSARPGPAGPRGEREAQVEVDGLGDVATGDRAVHQPLAGHPALPHLVDRRLQRRGDVLLREDDQLVGVVEDDRRAVPAYVEVRVTVGQVGDVQVDDPVGSGAGRAGPGG